MHCRYTGRIMLIGENQSIRRKTCASATILITRQPSLTDSTGLNTYLRWEATLRLHHGKNNRCLWETYQAQKYSAGVKRTAYLMLQQVVQIITTRRLTVNVHEEIYGLQPTLDWIRNKFTAYPSQVRLYSLCSDAWLRRGTTFISQNGPFGTKHQ